MVEITGPSTDLNSGNSISVPSQYQTLITEAAKALGLPISVVASQIKLESDFDPNAVSPTGAEGMAQFEPYTWKDFGTGSPFNPSDAMAAYIKYMGALLKQENGSVYAALEAYNAGPGNLKAGSGYAKTILERAGLFDTLKQGGTGQIPTAGNLATEGGQGIGGLAATGNPEGAWTSALSGVYNDVSGGILSWPSAFVGTFADADKAIGLFYNEAKLFFQPSTWVRAGAGIFGFLFLIIGIVMLAREAKTPS